MVAVGEMGKVRERKKVKIAHRSMKSRPAAPILLGYVGGIYEYVPSNFERDPIKGKEDTLGGGVSSLLSHSITTT
jgi:hypothetical protein